LILAILYSENKESGSTLGELANYIKKLDIDELNNENQMILFGGSVNLLHILNNLKAIQKKDNDINPKLLDYFNEFVKDEDVNFNRGFNGAARKIKQLGESSKYYRE
ncbi:hypothetical protein, partial [Acinetobacter variabilis]|uniref:hypothetical protein n=1 Tax=Acinetobacter variabilis TaxID=70346 RepID=UPI00376F6135